MKDNLHGSLWILANEKSHLMQMNTITKIVWSDYSDSTTTVVY